MKHLGVIHPAALREMRRDPDLPERVQRHLQREIDRRSVSPELQQGGEHDEIADDGDHHPHGE